MSSNRNITQAVEKTWKAPEENDGVKEIIKRVNDYIYKKPWKEGTHVSTNELLTAMHALVNEILKQTKPNTSILLLVSIYHLNNNALAIVDKSTAKEFPFYKTYNKFNKKISSALEFLQDKKLDPLEADIIAYALLKNILGVTLKNPNLDMKNVEGIYKPCYEKFLFQLDKYSKEFKEDSMFYKYSLEKMHITSMYLNAITQMRDKNAAEAQKILDTLEKNIKYSKKVYQKGGLSSSPNQLSDCISQLKQAINEKAIKEAKPTAPFAETKIIASAPADTSMPEMSITYSDLDEEFAFTADKFIKHLDHHFSSSFILLDNFSHLFQGWDNKAYVDRVDNIKNELYNRMIKEISNYLVSKYDILDKTMLQKLEKKKEYQPLKDSEPALRESLKNIEEENRQLGKKLKDIMSSYEQKLNSFDVAIETFKRKLANPLKTNIVLEQRVKSKSPEEAEKIINIYKEDIQSEINILEQHKKDLQHRRETCLKDIRENSVNSLEIREKLAQIDSQQNKAQEEEKNSMSNEILMQQYSDALGKLNRLQKESLREDFHSFLSSNINLFDRDIFPIVGRLFTESEITKQLQEKFSDVNIDIPLAVEHVKQFTDYSFMDFLKNPEPSAPIASSTSETETPTIPTSTDQTIKERKTSSNSYTTMSTLLSNPVASSVAPAISQEPSTAPIISEEPPVPPVSKITSAPQGSFVGPSKSISPLAQHSLVAASNTTSQQEKEEKINKKKSKKNKDSGPGLILS